MRCFFACLLSLVSVFSYASEYKASLIGTESIPGIQWSVSGINDKSQIYGGYADSSGKNMMYISDSNGSFTLIENENKQFYPFYSSANNAGQVVGGWNGSTAIFLWSRALGIRPINIFDTPNAQPISLNDLGQMIGTYYDYSPGCTYRPFLWDNGVLTDMGTGSEFVNNLESLGYQVMDIKLMDINNRGQMAGYFCYGKYSEKQKKFVCAGFKSFLWDGAFYLLPITSEEAPQTIKLNNRGVILLVDQKIDRQLDRTIETSYLWDIENGLQSLVNFYGKDLNDSSTVLGFERKYSNREYREFPGIWKEGQFISLADLLGFSSLYNMAPPYSDTYEIERIDNVVSINNKGEIACEGWVWGEKHPCILKPINNH